MTTAIAIFVKTPGVSLVKTRLARAIGTPAAEIFHLLAARAVAGVASAVGGDVQPYWAVAEAIAVHDPRWRDLPCVAQGEGGLGERQHRIYSTLLQRHDRVFLTGADIPHMQPGMLRQACTTLADPCTSFVLGEAEDGGYWLFGGRATLPRELWRGVEYSRPDTAQQLRAALQSHGVIGAAPTLFDVDRPGDLGRLAEALAALPAPLPAQRALLRWLSAGMGVHQRPEVSGMCL